MLAGSFHAAVGTIEVADGARRRMDSIAKREPSVLDASSIEASSPECPAIFPMFVLRVVVDDVEESGQGGASKPTSHQRNSIFTGADPIAGPGSRIAEVLE